MLTISRLAPVTRSRPAASRRYSLGRLMNSSTLLLLVVIAALIVVLALLILFHHNLNATKGYRLRSLERVRTELLFEEEVLNTEIAKSQSLQAIQNDAQLKGMVKPVKPKYAKGEEPIAKGIAERLAD